MNRLKIKKLLLMNYEIAIKELSRNKKNCIKSIMAK
jgi:hypothetical protein